MRPAFALTWLGRRCGAPPPSSDHSCPHVQPVKLCSEEGQPPWLGHAMLEQRASGGAMELAAAGRSRFWASASLTALPLA